MKEIGEALKEARENIGLSIEEVASDLKLRPLQIENIELGNTDAFKDIFYLKYLIRDYSKYLGLDYEDMVDEFNEYLFNHTSRLSLDDIKKAKKKMEKKENRVASPYTIERKNKSVLKVLIPVLLIILVLISIVVGINIYNNSKEKKPTTDIIS